MSELERLLQELCPDGVVYQELGDVVDSLKKGTLKTIDLIEDGIYPVINSGRTFYGKYNDYNNDGNAITFASRGEYAGYVNYIDEKFWAGGLCYPYRTKANSNLDTKFLYYFLKEKEEYIRKVLVDDGGIPALNKSTIEKLNVPIPPMEVQSEIVRILDNFTLLTAELTAELTARKQQYDCYRNKLIDEVVGKKGKLIELLVQPVTDGPHTTPVLYNEGVPFVSATSVYDGKVHLEDMKGYISKKYDEECSKKYKPKKFDVYMVKSGSTTGKVAIVDFEADFNIWSPLAALRTASATQAWYLYHLLQTQNVQEQVFSRMSHGSQPNLSMRVIEQFDVVIPSLEDQERIVNILNKFDSYCNDITQGLPAEIELRQKQYEYYRNKLLTFKEL